MGRVSLVHLPRAVVESDQIAIFFRPLGGYWTVEVVMKFPNFSHPRTIAYSSDSKVGHFNWFFVSFLYATPMSCVRSSFRPRELRAVGRLSSPHVHRLHVVEVEVGFRLIPIGIQQELLDPLCVAFQRFREDQVDEGIGVR